MTDAIYPWGVSNARDLANQEFGIFGFRRWAVSSVRGNQGLIGCGMFGARAPKDPEELPQPEPRAGGRHLATAIRRHEGAVPETSRSS